MQRSCRLVLAAAALALSAQAQSASIGFFGSASGSIFFGEQLAVTGLPQLGATFSVGIAYATPPTTCLQVVTPYAVWLVLGFSNQSWGALPLPLAMPQGFDLLVAPEAVVQAIVFSGTSCPPVTAPAQGPSFALTIPNDAGLLGLQFHQQILMANGPTVTFGLPPIASNGCTATIGL
jgi:hypothetical protein